MAQQQESGKPVPQQRGVAIEARPQDYQGHSSTQIRLDNVLPPALQVPSLLSLLRSAHARNPTTPSPPVAARRRLDPALLRQALSDAIDIANDVMGDDDWGDEDVFAQERS